VRIWRPVRCTRLPYTTLFRSENLPPLRHPRAYHRDTLPERPQQIRSTVPEHTAAILQGLKELVRLTGGVKTSSVSCGKQNPLHRSEEHTSELQSRENLVCRLL